MTERSDLDVQVDQQKPRHLLAARAISNPNFHLPLEQLV